jgi:prepilin-type N-terminal cleavage/methylation domain-containing protein
MATNMLNKRTRSRKQSKRHGQSGFSLLEMVMATLILTIGLLGVASAIGYALLASNRGRGITNAKMLIVSIQEQMETLRDTGQLNFNEISNSHVNGSNFSYFPTGFLPVSYYPGPDGVFGTNDDLVSPGPDGFFYTADDVTHDVTDPLWVRPAVTRQILITQVPNSTTLKKIQVTLRYSPNGGETRDLVGISYLNDDAHSNYVP